MKYNLRITVLIICFTFLYLDALSAFSLQFAVPAMQSGLTKLRKWTPLVRYVETQCGFDIELVIVKDHRRLAEGLSDKFYDVGFVNALWEEKLRQNRDIHSCARVEVNQKQFFQTSLIVNKDSVIRNMADMHGDYLALIVPYESLGGFYIPLVLFQEQSIVPTEVFKQVVYSETYESILKGVAFGVVDVGAIASTVLQDPRLEPFSREIRVIETSERLPQWALVGRNDLKSGMIDLFIKSLVEMKNSKEGQELLKAAGFSGFVYSSESTVQISHTYLLQIEQIDANSR